MRNSENPIDEESASETRSERGEGHHASNVEDFIATHNIHNKMEDVEVSSDVAQRVTELLQVPEEMFEDEPSLAVFVGASQIIAETHSNESLQNRAAGLIEYLTERFPESSYSPRAVKTESDHIKDEHNKKRDAYLETVRDDTAEQAFLERWQDTIKQAQEVWKKTGKNLTVEPVLVNDSEANFRRETHAGAYIEVPDDIDTNESPTIRFVMTTASASANESFIRHELYHLVDYPHFIRRGKEGIILENLDELHTEFAVGNYVSPDRRTEQTSNANYFGMKQIWDRLTFHGDIPFDLLENRTATIDTLVDKFGARGFTHFVMASPRAKSAFVAETFYSDSERPVMDMLIEQEKCLLRTSDETISEEDLGATVSLLEQLSSAMTPPEGDATAKYKPLVDFLTDGVSNVYGYGKTEYAERAFTKIAPEEAKELLGSWTKVAAILELDQSQAFLTDAQRISLLEAMSKIPYGRTNRSNKSLEDMLRGSSWNENDLAEEEGQTEAAESAFINLIQAYPDTGITHNLGHNELRDQMQATFVEDIDRMLEIIRSFDNPRANEALVHGLFRYNLATETRKLIESRLQRDPELAYLLEVEQEKYEGAKRRMRSMG